VAPPPNPGGDIYRLNHLKILTIQLTMQFLVAPHWPSYSSMVWRGLGPCEATAAGFFVAGKAAVSLEHADDVQEILPPILPDNQLGLEETPRTDLDTPSATGAGATVGAGGGTPAERTVEMKDTVEQPPTPKSLDPALDAEHSREKLIGFLRAFEDIKPFLTRATTSLLPEDVEKQFETFPEEEKTQAISFFHTYLKGMSTPENMEDAEAIERPGNESEEPTPEIEATSRLEGGTESTTPNDEETPKNLYWQLLVQKMLLVLLPSNPP